MSKEGKEYFEKLRYKRLRKVDKARHKIRNILEKYDCEYFEVVKLESIDIRFKTMKELKKTIILSKDKKKKVVCANCGSDNWITDSSQYEGDSGVDCKGTYVFEFMCPDCNKVNKATFNCVDVKLLKKKEL